MPTETDYAYAAGFVDGDGCFYLGRNGRKERVSLITVNTNLAVIEWLHSMFGGSIQRPVKQLGHKQLFHHVMLKNATLEAIPKLLPYLREKREEARLLLASQSSDFDEITVSLRREKQTGGLITPEQADWLRSLAVTETASLCDFAYLAGFMDAECCLGIAKNNPRGNRIHDIWPTYKIVMQCFNGKWPVFKFLRERFGGGFSFKLAGPGRTRNMMTYRLQCKMLSAVLTNVSQFLKAKRAQCDKLIELDRMTLPNGGARHTDTFRETYRMLIEQKERLFQEVRQLNLKGSVP